MLDKVIAAVRIQQGSKGYRTCLGTMLLGAGSKSHVWDETRSVDQFWARAVVRAFFAWLEADTFEKRNMALDAHRIGLSPLTEAEIAVLTETSYELDDRARLKRRTNFHPIDRLMRFALTTLARAYGIEVAYPVGTGGLVFQSRPTGCHRDYSSEGFDAIEINTDEITQVMKAFDSALMT